MNPEVEAALRRKIHTVTMPPVADLVVEVPEVVLWLRAQMTARPRIDGGGKPSGKPQSKPPFRIAYMAAADREVAALAFWCSQVGVHSSYPLWRKPDGTVAGVVGDDLRAVNNLVTRMLRVLEDKGTPDGMLDDPRYGLWTVRSAHYREWPELAGIFAAETSQPQEDVQEGLF